MKVISLKSFVSFLKNDSGAVVVDWVVLTAAIVGLAMVVLVPVATGTESMSGKTADYISDVNVGFMTE